jgi:hypothetical protein
MRRLGVIAVAAVALGVIAGAAASPKSDVAAVLLKPAQVGAGYNLRELPGGAQIRNEVTLDICGYRFASESLRLARHQVAYGRQGQENASLSNEVVAYRSGGAAQALREVRAAIAHCPTGFVQSTVKGVGRLRNRFVPFPHPGLLPGAIAYVDHVTEQLPNKTVTRYDVVIVYQARHDVLSGVYGDGTSNIQFALHASVAAAKNLRAL